MQEDFKEYLKEARQKFCKEVNKHSVGENLVLRTEIDSFLIAYDQAVAKAFSLSGVVSSADKNTIDDDDNGYIYCPNCGRVKEGS